MRLYTAPLSMFGMKVEIAIREKGLPFERIEVAYDPIAGYSPKHPDVVRINPKQQVPVVIHNELGLFDSTQLFEYLEDIAPDPHLWPKRPTDRAIARQLEHQADEVYFPSIIKLMGLQGQLDTPHAIAAVDAAELYYASMEQQIKDGEYLCGAYTFADIAFYMAQLFGERMGAPLTSQTPRLVEWRHRVGKRSSVKPVITRLVDYLRQNGRAIPPHLRIASTNFQ